MDRFCDTLTFDPSLDTDIWAYIILFPPVSGMHTHSESVFKPTMVFLFGSEFHRATPDWIVFSSSFWGHGRANGDWITPLPRILVDFDAP